MPSGLPSDNLLQFFKKTKFPKKKKKNQFSCSGSYIITGGGPKKKNPPHVFEDKGGGKDLEIAIIGEKVAYLSKCDF